MPDHTRAYDHVLGFALEHPWALTKPMLAVVAGILAHRLAGKEPDAAVLAGLTNRSSLPQPKRGGAVAVIPINGVIAPKMNMFSDVSGGTTFEALTAQLRAAVEDDTIKTIVFDVDSPGGNVAGATEFAREVLAARTKKPIIAVANYLMASAAYWPMACATEIVASPSALVGAIGIYTIHDDMTEALKQEGITRTVISAGKYKGETINGPLTDDAHAHMQALISDAYKHFIDDVGKGRGVTAASVRNGFAEGRAVSATEAHALGMVDRVATLSDTLARVMTAPPSTLRATDLNPAITAVTGQEPPIAATPQELAANAAALAVLTGELLALDA